MRYTLVLLMIAALIAAGCETTPKATHQDEQTQETTVVAPEVAEAETHEEVVEEPEIPYETEENEIEDEEPEVRLPRPEIPEPDAQTRDKISRLIETALNQDEKPEVRQDAILVDMVEIGPIASTAVLWMPFDWRADGHAWVLAEKFFRLLPEKDAYDMLARNLFNDDVRIRGAADDILVNLTGMENRLRRIGRRGISLRSGEALDRCVGPEREASRAEMTHWPPFQGDAG
jgi:hypothetical protein